MDYCSHRVQSTCSKCKALSISNSLKYTSENGIPPNNQSTPTLPMEGVILDKKGNLHDDVKDSRATFVVLEQPDCSKGTKSEEQVCDRILEKLHAAYVSLCPVIDEIIRNATEYTATTANTQTIEYSEDAVCSVTHEQYIGAIKASHLIQEIHSDVLQSTKVNLELTKEDTFHLPAPNFIVNSVQHSIFPKVEDDSVDASRSRVYIEKNVVEQLIELYNLLHGALQQFSQVAEAEEMAFSQTNEVLSRNCSSVFKTFHDSHDTFKQSNSCITDNPDNSRLLTKLQEEYQGLSDAVDMLKSIIKETSGSISDIKKLKKSLQDTRKTKSDNSVVEIETSKKITDVSGARRCILECLCELAEVRKYLKKAENTKEPTVVSQICLATNLKKECCGKQNIPHIHARLNGIPIVVKLNQCVSKTVHIKPQT